MILNDLSTWPTEVVTFLGANHDLFLAWEQRLIGQQPIIPLSGPDYDRAIMKLRQLLNPHALRGFHCTRLTEAEIERVGSTGMQPPNATILGRRIQALLQTGSIEQPIAERLLAENLANEDSRAGKIWFCFFPPERGGQSGIDRFFRHWGGEALYAYHETDPETGPILRGIGIPCVIEADVLVSTLEIHSFLDIKIARRYLISRGFETGEPTDHEDRAKSSIAAANIRRVIRHPGGDFCDLTGCRSWRPPLA